MTKKRLFIGLLGLAVVVSCLIIVASSASQLPPDMVKPNSKPALSGVQHKSSLSVASAPAQDAVVVSTEAAHQSPKSLSVTAAAQTKPEVAGCDSSNTPQSAILNTAPKPVAGLGDQLQRTVASASGLQIPRASSVLSL